mmetsp:Transcript_42035/g.75768  ORF Transcript_42035/g.75768 Transcript_42035/m.75768 type:complete len:162 (+) Transcript_42035:258-743(+)|eukprot:CAMPEP_0201875806 /NCGR_PEP_ID=MMETSP0902-20130614/7677_1 /ASSEMBLY_ACC=CAM_ASM_000551 /TAXON_ID=420261 /ORGANISM="Thalassiosira antarctica, Strain CCMP982" /LENGTH=161 /DNA_ID=CAMNT_0048402929 /DNA_START=108 /DNA_END=593 /DNA_ORIENTATION=-
MSGGKNGVLHPHIMDDAYVKALIVLSILIICLVILTIIIIFVQIRDYQETRNDHFDEASQMDQIDYLIGLLDAQEKILKMEMEGRSKDYVQKELERFLALHREFSEQLNGLHGMMAGMSTKSDNEYVTKGKTRFYSWFHQNTDGLKSYSCIRLKTAEDIRT